MESLAELDVSARTAWNEAGLGAAPPPFVANGRRIVPIEIEKSSLFIHLDIRAQVATGRALLEFRLSEKGYAMLDMVPDATALKLNGLTLPPARLVTVAPPGGEAGVRMLDIELERQPGAGADMHRLEIEYRLSSESVTFMAGGVACAFFMTDLSQRSYLELHAPANLEFDQSPMALTITVENATDPHQLFTNGVARQSPERQSWTIEFPDYFTCSSPFLHLTNRSVAVLRDKFIGAEREIPLTVYGSSGTLVRDGLARAREALQELERTYGPYAHSQLTIYMTAGGGGMEYCGATTTSLFALAHELTHSWFARGVMPGNGNAGWIDEAIASWRDNGYPSARPNPDRDPVNLAGFSPYRRHTPRDAYTLGALFLSELDFLLQPHGLRPVLRKLYLTYRRRLITTPMFEAFVIEESGLDLAAMFRRFVYGVRHDEAPRTDRFFLEGAAPELTVQELVRKAWERDPILPPRPFTREELKELL